MNNAVSSHKGRAIIDQFDVSQFITKMSPVRQQVISDCTTLADDYKECLPSLKDGSITFEGLYRKAQVGLTTLDDIFGSLPDTPFIVAGHPNGRAAGKTALMIYADVVSYSLDAVVGDLVKCSISCVAQQRAVERGVSLHDLTAETATGNGTAVDNLAATTNGGVLDLHVTAIAGASPSVVVKVQHSTNGTVWADLQAFTAAVAAAKERIEIAAGTTINEFLRVVHTFGGTTTSITYQSNFARR